jgi:hypothetical protein
MEDQEVEQVQEESLLVKLKEELEHRVKVIQEVHLLLILSQLLMLLVVEVELQQ